MREVTSAEYVAGYKIRAGFDNDGAGVVDLNDSLWRPVLEPPKSRDAFRRVTVSPGR